jgi:hypothetical protein
MWYPMGVYTLDQARRFLRDDFSKVIRRARFLYVDSPQHPDLGFGFFEPVQLSLCWCDFLGSLYNGTTRGGNGTRIRGFVNNVLGEVNTDYCGVAEDLLTIYRHGMVHGYAPDGIFQIVVPAHPEHLRRHGGAVVVSVARLLDDLLQGVYRFGDGLTETGAAPGSLAALNAGRAELG